MRKSVNEVINSFHYWCISTKRHFLLLPYSHTFYSDLVVFIIQELFSFSLLSCPVMNVLSCDVTWGLPYMVTNSHLLNLCCVSLFARVIWRYNFQCFARPGGITRRSIETKMRRLEIMSRNISSNAEFKLF